MTDQERKNQDLNEQLQFAADLHGHFGPFLALGVRMGLLGLQELGLKKGKKELHATVMLTYVTPISCILDGIQTSTQCTVGNGRLLWRNSGDIGAIFQLRDSTHRVEVWIRPTVFQELNHRLEAKPSDEETRQIGLDIASRTDSELFMEKR
jgi:formylmethanofuran dehydrogenase subunit E